MTQNTTFSPEIKSQNKLKSSLSIVPSIAISRAVHAAGHDLRSPLFVLRGYSQLLLRTENLGDFEVKKLQLMVEATKKMEKLINGLVELVDFQTLDFEEENNILIEYLFEEVKFELINEISDNNATIYFKSVAGLSIQMNQKYIYNILKHVIQNALVHNVDKENLNVTVTIEKVKNILKILVEDDGFGMDLAQGDARLYKPFYRHSILGKRLGVGLSLVKTIVDRLGGRIAIESKVNEGTRCTVLLEI